MADDSLGTLVAKLGADLTDLKAGLLEGKSQLGDFKNVVSDTVGQVKKLLSFAGISLGFYELISQVREFGSSVLEEGGKVELLKGAVESLGAYYGMSAASIDVYVQKLKNLGVTEQEAYKAISGFEKAGLSIAKLPDLAQAAKVLGASMGKPLQETFDLLVQGIVKGTPRELMKMVPGIQSVYQSMGADVRNLLDSTVISGTEKSEILLNAVLAMADKMKGAASVDESYYTKLNEYKAKVAAIKEALFGLVKPIGMAITAEEIKSWDDFYGAVGKNKAALKEIGQTVAGYIQSFGAGVREIASFVAAHADLLKVLGEIKLALMLMKWTGISAGAEAVSQVLVKLGLLRVALSGPWQLIIVATLVGFNEILERSRQLADQQRIANLMARSRGDISAVTGQAVGPPLSAAERAQFQAIQDANLKAKYASKGTGPISAFGGPPPGSAAKAEADTAAAKAKAENAINVPPKPKKGKSLEEKVLEAHMQMLQAKRAADLAASEDEIATQKATLDDEKANLELSLAEGLIDGQTYYKRLQEFQQQETASALALIQKMKQAQMQAYQDELAVLSKEENDPAIIAEKGQALAQKNRMELAKLDAESAKIQLNGAKKITEELTRQVELKQKYAESTAGLNIETAELLGRISEQEAVLQKLYLDWQKAKAQAIKEGAAPGDLAALQANYQAKAFDASYLGQHVKQTSSMLTTAFGDLASTLLKGGTRFSQAVEQFGQQLEQQTFKMFFQDLSNAIIQGIRNMVSSIQQSSSGGGDIGGIFGKLIGGLFSSRTPSPTPEYQPGGGAAAAVASAFSAHGNIFDRGRRLAFAGGGVFTGPTLFPMAGGMGLAGEAGEEGILPLARVRGDLGVKALFAPAGPAQVTIINNTGVQAEGQAQHKDDGTLEIVLEQKLANMVALGGPLQKTIQSVFGLKKGY